jgi:hypothetical protein
MSQLPAVEAQKVVVGSLLWWPDCNMLWRWGRSMVELLLLLLLLLELPRLELWAIAPIMLLLWSTQLTPRWGIHHVVLGRSTARTTTASESRHHPLSLFLIGLSNGLHHPLLVNGCTWQPIVQQAREMHQLNFVSSHPTSMRPSPHRCPTWHRSPRGRQAWVAPSPEALTAADQGW